MLVESDFLPGGTLQFVDLFVIRLEDRRLPSAIGQPQGLGLIYNRLIDHSLLNSGLFLPSYHQTAEMKQGTASK